MAIYPLEFSCVVIILTLHPGLHRDVCVLCEYTGRFIMLSVITNIYNKKTKRPNSMELFTATGKLEKFFLATRDVRFVHHGWYGTHRYDIQVPATHASTWVYRYSSLLQWSVPLGQRGHVAMVLCVLCTKCTLHSNHRLSRVIFQHTKRLLPGAAIFSLHTFASPSGRNVNYDEKQLTGKKNWVVPSICRGCVNTCPMVFL